MWSKNQEEKFKNYQGKYGSVLIDKIESNGYTLSLWHYAEGNFYEVNINYGDLDFTDPNIQKYGKSGQIGLFPVKKFRNALISWINKYGHLSGGSTNEHRVKLYKALIKRLIPNVKIEDIDFPLPVDGHFFFAMLKDTDAMNRLRKMMASSM